MAPDVRRRARARYYTPAPLVRSMLDAALVALVAGRARLRRGGGRAAAARPRSRQSVALLDELTAARSRRPAPAPSCWARWTGCLTRGAATASAHAAAAAAGSSSAICSGWTAARPPCGSPSSASGWPSSPTIGRIGPSGSSRCPTSTASSARATACSSRSGGGPAARRRPRPAPRPSRPSGGGSSPPAGRRSASSCARSARRNAGRRRHRCSAAEVGGASPRRRVLDARRGARTSSASGAGVDARAPRARSPQARAELRALRGRAPHADAAEREVPWFHYQSHFADVFAGGGFDLVVGNPPWLRAEEIPPEMRRRLAGRYRWWRGAGAAFGHRPDLAVAFLERARGARRAGRRRRDAGARQTRHRRLRRRGPPRARGVDDADPRRRISPGSPDAAFDATVYPLALVARKAPPPRRPSRAHDPARRASVQRRLPAESGSARRRAVDPDRGPRRERPRAGSRASIPSLGDRFTCQLGVKTGANHVFLDPPATVEPSLVRWAVRGRDVRPFTAARARRGCSGLTARRRAAGPVSRPTPPRTSRRTTRCLRARADFAGGPAWTLFRTRAATAPHRVVWSDLARRLTACALTGRAARAAAFRSTPATCAAPAPPRQAERLAAWLNSTWVRARGAERRRARRRWLPSLRRGDRRPAAAASRRSWPIPSSPPSRAPGRRGRAGAGGAR